MARINIEECWWSDPRRLQLIMDIGFEADAAAINMWRTAQEFWGRGRRLIPKKIFERIRFADKLIDAGLAEIKTEEEVYVCGSSDYLDWVQEKRDAAKVGGKKSAQRPRDEKGRLLPKQDPSNVQAESKCVQASDSGSDSGSDSKKENIYAQTSVRASVSLVDFEKIYSDYPRKQGKAKGIKKARAEIKTQDDLAMLAQAIQRYRDHCRNNKIEAQYIKHFSTFMGEWRDWLDPNIGTTESYQPDPFDFLEGPSAGVG